MLRWILFVTIFVTVMLFLTSSSCENMSSLNNEAVQNIASVFNSPKPIFGNLQINGNLTVTGSCNIVPKGMITPFFGTTIPQGWAICDGTNGTPNMSMRFLLGNAPKYRSDYPLAQYGGSTSVALTDGSTQTKTPSYGISYATTLSRPNQVIGNIDYVVDGTQPIYLYPSYYCLLYIMKL